MTNIKYSIKYISQITSYLSLQNTQLGLEL